MLITVLKGRLLMWVYPLWSAYNVFTSKDVCIHSKGNMTAVSTARMRSEERRVGKECRSIKLPRRVVYVQ